MELYGKSAVVLVEEMFNELELFYPYYRLKEAGMKVVLVGSKAKATYKGKCGLEATSDLAASEVWAGDYDAVIIPGGYAPDHMRRNPAMVELVQKANEQGKVLGAICHAGWMLASAEILPKRTVTSFVAIKDDLVHAGANWIDEEVVVDKNLITSRTPDDLPAFMRAIIRALEEQG